LLASTHRVFAVDLRGFGDSANAPFPRHRKRMESLRTRGAPRGVLSGWPRARREARRTRGASLASGGDARRTRGASRGTGGASRGVGGAP
jgi:hypothetical protein